MTGWLYGDALNPVAQLDAGGRITHTYVYATRGNVPDMIVEHTSAGGVAATYRVIADHLGSVRMGTE